MKNLKNLYKKWRETLEEQSMGITYETDCGLESVREDFTEYAELENEITFEEMLILEREFENEIQ